MQATSLTGGCTTVALVLGVIGLYLDSLAAVAGAMGLAGLLCGQGVLFLSRTARFAEAIVVERVAETRPAYLGVSVELAVRVTAPPAPGLQVRLADLPPASAVYDPADAVLRGGEGRYRVRFMAPGEVAFRGLCVETANRFFTTSFVRATPADAGERLMVLPVDVAGAASALGDVLGTQESPRTGYPPGDGVREFRPFRQGDDPARIDWKLTAKHDRPFVREPTSQAASAHLVVVDLPDSSSPAGEAALSAASSEVKRVIREQGHCSLLVIAGGEVIAYRHHERNLATLLRLLGLQPPGRVHPLYRVLDPAVLAERLRSAERELSIPSQRWAAALRTALASEARSDFEQEVDRVLSASERGEVVVYTAAPSDVSHLNLIAAAARRRRRRVVIRTRTARKALSWLSPYPRVEAI